MKRLISLAAILIVGSTVAFADIAPAPGKSPNRVKKPEPGIPATLSIKLDRDAKEAKLVIPKAQIKQLRAELEMLDTDDNTAAISSPGTFSRTQTIVSGMFLSLAVVFGGMLFMRSGKPGAGTKALIALVVIGGIGSAATLVFANVGPPPEARSITSRLFDQKTFSPYRFASGKIVIETSSNTNGNVIELIVPDPPATPAAE